MDRLIKSSDESGKSNSISYDAMDRPASITDALGHNQHSDHDNNGYLTGIVDGTGKLWKFDYDAEGVLDTENPPGGQSYHYQKDRRGYITGITDPLGVQTKISPGFHKPITEITDQAGRKTC
jgi:YD repeat-containing protein